MKCECNEKESFFKSEKFERIFTIGRIIIALALTFLGEYLPNIEKTVTLILTIIGYVIISYDVFIAAFKNIIKGKVFDEHFLMLVGTIGALCISYYTEAIFVMAFYHLGELLEDYAEDKSKDSISKLVNDMPLLAHKVNGEQIEEVDPQDIKIGDVIKVLPGEKVSLDGIVIKGNSMLNLSSLTGESLPQEVEVNQEVYSGSINMDGVIYIKVTKLFEDSTLSKILEMITQEETKKSKSERFIDKFAAVYTPIVVSGAVILFLVKYGMANWGSNYVDALYDACTLLIISCPCALVVSIPLTFFLGIGRASRIGVLIKGGQSLENIAHANLFAFDKTGTITKGEFEVVECTNDETLLLAASLEINSTHPIGVSIVKKAENRELKKVEDFYSDQGFGINGIIDETKYYLGDEAYVKKLLPEGEFIQSAYKVLYVFTKEKIIGHLIVSDVVKSNAKDMSEVLKKIGNPRLVMLSGDRQAIVDSIKEEAELDQGYGELLPQDKLDLINQFKKDQNKVVFVGDGVNDAPSLLASDTGIAMGGLGSDAAKQSADIVILDDNLSKIVSTREIGKQVMKIVIENIVIILAVKLLIFILAILHIPSLAPYQMYLASFADVGTLVIGVLNSMRIYYYKIKKAY